MIPINRENYPRLLQKAEVEVEVEVQVTKNYIIRHWLCALCACHNNHGKEGK